MKHTIYIIFGILLSIGCSYQPTSNITKLEFGPGDEDDIRLAFINLVDSTEVNLAEGIYNFEKLSIIGKLANISLKGAGPDKTIIDFSSQASGGEGLRIDNINQLTISDLQLRESKGDLLKVKDCDGVELINVHTIWESEANKENGGYGLYPVSCENVLIDGCYAKGASDAGIYVGQSNKVIVRNSKAELNVAGIEIENTTDAEVFNNESTNNTGGLLVFDLPGLSQAGGNVKVYKNRVYNNNYRNWAPAANSATGVGNVPPGTGIMILCTSDVEVYDNRVENNNTMPIGILSFLTVDPNIIKNDPTFKPIPYNIYLHDNEISKKDEFPEHVRTHELSMVLVSLDSKLKESGFPGIPPILFDGITLQEGDNPTNICIKEKVSYLNMDVGNEFASPSYDNESFNCEISL